MTKLQNYKIKEIQNTKECKFTYMYLLKEGNRNR